MKYKNILQIDDDFDDCEFFQQALEGVSTATYMALHNPIEALQKLIDKEIKPDLIFLDINMPNLTGLQLLDMLPLTKTKVILTTAHSKFAVDGYQYDNIVSFLLKPVMFDMFIKAVHKVRPQNERLDVEPKETSVEMHDQKPQTVRANTCQSTDIKSSADEETYPCYNQDAMWIKVEKQMHRIEYEEISFFEGSKNYVKIYVQDYHLLTRASLSDLQRQLPAARFVRTHRSYIVNREAVKKIDGNTITMNNSYKVSISKPDRNEVFKALTN